MDRSAVLKGVPLFEGLGDGEVDQIAALTTVRAYRQGDVIFREGDPGEALYIVADGVVRISKVVPGVGEEAMAFFEPGSYFGEMSLIDEFPRSATAIAHTDCGLLLLPKGAFRGLLSADREVALKILWQLARILSHRLRETTDRIVTLFAIAKAF